MNQFLSLNSCHGYKGLSDEEVAEGRSVIDATLVKRKIADERLRYDLYARLDAHGGDRALALTLSSAGARRALPIIEALELLLSKENPEAGMLRERVEAIEAERKSWIAFRAAMVKQERVQAESRASKAWLDEWASLSRSERALLRLGVKNPGASVFDLAKATAAEPEVARVDDVDELMPLIPIERVRGGISSTVAQTI